MNHVTLKGTIGRDPELRTVGQNGIQVASGSIAVKKQFEKDGESKEITTWIDVKAWRELAVKFGAMKQGDLVWVIGELTSESWEDKDSGKKRSKLLVTAQAITSGFAGGKKAQPEMPAKVKPARKTEPASDPDNDDVPF